MGIRRYARAPVIGINFQYGTSRAIKAIRDGISNGTIRFRQTILKDGQRLDTIAGEVYGDGRDGWIIAAASEIGWAMQVPPGTIINIPNREDVKSFVG